MNSRQQLVTTLLGALCLLFTLMLIYAGRTTNQLQTDLNAQQDEINKGSISQQIGMNLLREMGQVALKNNRMRELLQRAGYTVTPAPTEPPAAPTAPTTPAAPPK